MKEHTSFNVVGKTAHFFASNKPLSLLVLISVLVLGLFSFVLTAKQYNPEIVRPAFSITLTYAGATPHEAFDRVVYELIEEVSAVPGVDEIYTEVRDGAHIGATVIFDVGYDKTKAKVELLSQLREHSSLAQGYITEPSIAEINPETIPVLQVVFSSPTLPISEVRKRAIELSRELTYIEEVSDVSIVGGYTPSMVIEIDPLRMERAGITIPELSHALSQGETRMVMSGFENDVAKVGVVFDSQVSTAEDIGLLTVNPPIRVRDVAHVYEGALPSRAYVLYDTKDIDPTEVVMLAISKVEGSSAPAVTKAVRERLDSLMSNSTFSELTYQVVSDDGVTATGEIQNLTSNLLTSILIVALVLFLFLSLRAASIVLIAIPTTLLIVFGVGFLFDQTINRITLFALILSLGLLVDAAIVVVENMYVHLKRASVGVVDATRELIIAGSVNEIGVGLFLSTITSVIVFLPVSYITGMMGPYMGPIAFFVPVALTVSMLVAIIIVPFVASRVLKADEAPTRLARVVDQKTQQLIYGYKMFIRRIVSSRTLQKKVLLGTLGLFIVVLVFPFTGLEHFQMLPRADRDQFYVYIDAPIGTSRTETRRIAENISQRITDDADVLSVQQFVGVSPIVDFNGMFKGAQYRAEAHQATFRVNLKSASERTRSSTDIVTDIRSTVREQSREYAHMTRFIEEPPGPPVRATLVAKVTSSDVTHTEKAAIALMSLIAQTEGVVDPYVSIDAPIGDITYTFNYEQAAALGVSEADVRHVLSLYGDATSLVEYMGAGGVEFIPVSLVLPRAYMDAPTDVGEFRVRTAEGVLVPISAVLTQAHTPRGKTIYAERAEELTYITGEVEVRPIIYVVIDIMFQLIRGDLVGYSVSAWNLSSLTLTDDTGGVVTLTWGGEWEMTLENFRDLGIAMGVALLLVYATLVAQYRSFSKPGFIMITVPLGLIGILVGFLLLDQWFGIYLTATALIGFIALIGIVVNNAIIFSEYVDQEREEGTSYREALIEAGGARFRPIMLTSLTTILGSLTIVSDPVWSGLAWSIVFGLSLSTILTLIVYPTLLAYFEDTHDNGTVLYT